MAHHAIEGNPFLMMINPEVVLAAVERLERLGQLNRQLCRPLDRPTRASELPADSLAEDDDSEEDSVSA